MAATTPSSWYEVRDGRRLVGRYDDPDTAADAATDSCRVTGRHCQVEHVARPVCVAECPRCGLSVYGFAETAADCPRCGRPEMPGRWINKPTPNVSAKAECGAAE